MSETDWKWLRALIILAVAVLSIWLVGALWGIIVLTGDVLLLFFLAWLLAFVLSPFSRWFREHGAPAIVAVILVYLGLAVVISLVGFLVTPALLEQLQQLAANSDAIGNSINDFIILVQNQLIAFGVRDVDLASVYSSVIGQFQTIFGSLLQNTINLITGIANLFFGVIIVLILSFYINLDGGGIRRNAIRLVPKGYRDSAQMLSDSIDRNFGGFLRGQILVAFAYAILTYVVLMFGGFSYSLIISIISGIAMIIPFIGAPLALVLPFVVVLLENPGALWWVIVVLLIIQQVMLNVVSPRVMSQTVGIHPLLVFLALLLGAKFGGVWGAIFGIPVVGVLSVMARHIYHLVAYRHSLEMEAAEEDNLHPDAPIGSHGKER